MSSEESTSVAAFRDLYERHVNHVAAGRMSDAIADIVRENIPQVFEGVDVPRAAVAGFAIKDVRSDGERMVGETVYDLGDRSVGLRSIWEFRDGRWLAAELENFPAATDAAK
ncbi:hypothetical protein F8M49_14415 [Rhodococcus zopfii]|uniref:SnoaL-like domain-containing protein n=1 Tax=Rhodococcus zopfii TaxID=43772 RepID=A0ABU3WQI7_9NOCA|nr:hypothetical protein [Rhodococcus zopfii]MDV2476241.1 hypothetical protein [Rhodococcus zopfii]